MDRLSPATEFSLRVVAVYLNKFKLSSDRVSFISPSDEKSRRFKENTYRPIQRYPDERREPKVGLEQVTTWELTIVTFAVVFWMATIYLFFNKWGKIRMLEPYQPAYRESSPTGFAHSHPSMHNLAQSVGTGSGPSATSEHVAGQVILANLGTGKIGSLSDTPTGGAGTFAELGEGSLNNGFNGNISPKQEDNNNNNQFNLSRSGAAGTLKAGNTLLLESPIGQSELAAASSMEQQTNKLGPPIQTSGLMDTASSNAATFLSKSMETDKLQLLSSVAQARRTSRSLLLLGKKRFGATMATADEPTLSAIFPRSQLSTDAAATETTLNYLFQKKAQTLARATTLWSRRKKQLNQFRASCLSGPSELELFARGSNPAVVGGLRCRSNYQRASMSIQASSQQAASQNEMTALVYPASGNRANLQHRQGQVRPSIQAARAAFMRAGTTVADNTDRAYPRVLRDSLGLVQPDAVRRGDSLRAERAKQSSDLAQRLASSSSLGLGMHNFSPTSQVVTNEPFTNRAQLARDHDGIQRSQTTDKTAQLSNSRGVEPYELNRETSGQMMPHESKKMRRLAFMQRLHQHHHVATSTSSSTLVRTASSPMSSALKINSVSLDNDQGAQSIYQMASSPQSATRSVSGSSMSLPSCTHSGQKSSQASRAPNDSRKTSVPPIEATLKYSKVSDAESSNEPAAGPSGREAQMWQMTHLIQIQPPSPAIKVELPDDNEKFKRKLEASKMDDGMKVSSHEFDKIDSHGGQSTGSNMMTSDENSRHLEGRGEQQQQHHLEHEKAAERGNDSDDQSSMRMKHALVPENRQPQQHRRQQRQSASADDSSGILLEQKKYRSDCILDRRVSMMQPSTSRNVTIQMSPEPPRDSQASQLEGLAKGRHQSPAIWLEEAQNVSDHSDAFVKLAEYQKSLLEEREQERQFQLHVASCPVCTNLTANAGQTCLRLMNLGLQRNSRSLTGGQTLSSVEDEPDQSLAVGSTLRPRISSMFVGSFRDQEKRDSFAMLSALSQKKSKSAEDVAYLSSLVLQIWSKPDQTNPLLKCASSQEVRKQSRCGSLQAK